MSDEPVDEEGTPDADDADASDATDGPRGSSGRSTGATSGRGSGRSTSGGSSDDSGSTSSAGDDSSTGSEGSTTASDGGVLGDGTTPPDDEELPLTEHIEEMLARLAKVVIPASLIAPFAFLISDDVIARMWYDVHDGTLANCLTTPQAEGCIAPHLYSPLEFLLTRLRFTMLAVLVVGLPMAVYQTYRFMRPGLYPHERRYYLASVPFSLVLGVVGMLFSYFVILPLLFTYFITYTEGSADPAFALADTMNLVLIMLGFMAVVFQIPLLIMLAIMMGITSRRWLEERRIYFWGLFLGLAFMFGPDPTGMAPVLLTVTMIVLYEASLLLLRWTGR